MGGCCNCARRDLALAPDRNPACERQIKIGRFKIDKIISRRDLDVGQDRNRVPLLDDAVEARERRQEIGAGNLEFHRKSLKKTAVRET